MAFRWRANDGLTLNTGLVVLWFFRGSRPVLLRNPILLSFSRGPGPLSPSGYAHGKYAYVHLGQTWFSCSLYSFYSEQAEQKSSALEHLCWRTPEFSVFGGGADRTVTWPVPKKMADHCLHVRYILYRLIYSRVLQSAQFYLFLWLFWRTPSTLKIAKSSPPLMYYNGQGWFTIL